MDIIEIPREEGTKGLFQNLCAEGLIDYPASGYERWNWQYMENPFLSKKTPAIWICVSDGKTLGYLGAIRVELKVGSRKINAGWAVDFRTLPTHRRKGVGKALVDKANRSFDLFFSIGQTDMAAGLFIKMGWRQLERVPYYVKIFDAKNLIRRKIGNPIISNFVSIGLNIFFKILECLNGFCRMPEIDIERIDGFYGEETDLFWESISAHYEIIVPRDSAYLTWKYDKQPGMDYVKFRALCGNKPCGYIIIRIIESEHDVKEGLIVDVIVKPHDKDAIYSLVLAGLRYLRTEGCHVVRCCINHKNVQSALEKCGFIKRRSTLRFLINKNIDGLDELYNLDNWYVSSGDCDIDR